VKSSAVVLNEVPHYLLWRGRKDFFANTCFLKFEKNYFRCILEVFRGDGTK
jgi:hypothetical protein